MPCNVSHTWYKQVSKGRSVPFLHMVECVAEEIKETKLKPLEAGSPLRIGVLATNATLAAGFYKAKLQNEVISL
ncbi:Asp/Glu/hydantoin racemase [Sesbania bispinosa]|nr:Asp/Glu/hydantoin racemase [Sesbania bispinosa]